MCLRRRWVNNMENKVTIDLELVAREVVKALKASGLYRDDTPQEVFDTLRQHVLSDLNKATPEQIALKLAMQSSFDIVSLIEESFKNGK